MRREHARVAAISSLATLLLGCASTPAATPAAIAPGKAAAASATASSKTTNAPKGASSLPATSTNLEEQIQAAIALRMHGDTAQATRALAQLVLVAPDDPRVLGEYGKALVQQNRADDAVAFLKRAIEIKANDWAVYSALGVAYDQMDDRKNAKAAYDRALLLHPGDPTVLNNYAVSRMLAKDYNAAERLLMQARAAGGDLPKIAGNLQLLAQLRAPKASPAASVKPIIAASGQQKTIAPASAPAQAAETTSAPVVVMQRVPSDASSATARSTSRPASQLAVTSTAVPANPASAHQAASAPPRAITPNVRFRASDPATDQVAKAAVKRAHETQEHARAETGSARASHAGQITIASGEKSATQKATFRGKMSASAEQKKPAVAAQKDKAPVLPALRTAD